MSQDLLDEIEDSGRDYRDMTEEKMIEVLYQMAPKYRNTDREIIVMSKIDGSWKMDVDKTRTLVYGNLIAEWVK